MERKLLDYLPPFLQEYKEIKAILEDGEQVDIDELWKNTELTLDNQFIMSMTDYGVLRWEKMLDIVPKGDATLDERKFKILSVINAKLPYTLRRLKQLLATLCGENGYTVILYNNKYNLIVKLAIENENNVQTVKDLLSVIVPCNLTINVYLFNMHKFLQPIRHKELAEHTHFGVRTDLFIL